MSNRIALMGATREPQTRRNGIHPNKKSDFEEVKPCCLSCNDRCAVDSFNLVVSSSKKRLYRLEPLLRGLAIVTSPAISTWRRLNPNRNGEFALQGCGRWPPIAGTNMTTRFAQFGLNMGFDVVECFTLHIQKNAIKRNNVPHINDSRQIQRSA